MRKYVTFVMILEVVLVIGVCFAVAPLARAVELPQQKVTIQKKQLGLRDALTSLLQETKLKYRLSNNITNEKKVILEAYNVKWAEVFESLISEEELNFRVTNKRLILVSP